MKNYIVSIFIVFFLISCSDEVWRGIPISGDTPAPPPVTDVQVTAIPGGAVINYTLPKSDHLLYVMGEYTLGDKIVEKKSSLYSNKLTLEGFPDEREYSVRLYSVSRDGVKSAPVNITVTPLTPPIISIYNSIVMEPTFGGVRILFDNENESEVKLTVLTTDSIGDMIISDIHYTSRKNGNFSVRGFESEERLFGLYIQDRWNNTTDTISTTLIPWFEEELDKFRFSPLTLPSDTYENHLSGTILSNLWNGLWGGGTNSYIFHTKPNTGIPQWFTFDLGVQARLSRFKFHHRHASSSGSASDGQYSAGDPRKMEVYGSNAPNPDGSWDDSWTLLGSFESIKPSGGSGWTSEDIQFACIDGEDFEFPSLEEGYRYLRFKITEVWGGVTYIYMEELTFWGEVLEIF